MQIGGREEEVEGGSMIGTSGLAGEASSSSLSVDRLKAEIASHPLYQQLLSAHVDCLYVATPTHHRPMIDAQLANSHNLGLLTSCASAAHHSLSSHDRHDLDTFMGEYLVLLCSLKDQLETHVKVDALEAVMACRAIENAFQALTGNYTLLFLSLSLSTCFYLSLSLFPC
uniref:KNOX1 domain-containing protein n=1 Tax=Kalanchoe fedtschenkoi TaxID=63787 RepID=A0A7N0RBG1_KALFE